MRITLSFLALALALCIGAGAKTVTVNSGGGADHSTVAAALTDVLAAADGADIINITGGGPYDEALGIDAGPGVDLTIQGTDPVNRPILAVQNVAASGNIAGGDGLSIWVDGSVTLRNLVIIPSTTSTPTDDLVMVSAQTNPSGQLDFLVTNCLLSANDGSNAPLNDDPYNLADTTGATQVPDDGLYMASGYAGGMGNINATVEYSSIIQHGAGDVLVMADNNNNLDNFTVGPGVNLAGGNWGIQYAGSPDTITIQGTKADPVVSANNAVGVLFYSSITSLTVEHMIFASNLLGARIDADTNVGTVGLSDCIFADNDEDGLVLFWTPTAAQSWTFDQCTFHNNGFAPYTGYTGANVRTDLGVTSDLTATFTDCIFSSGTISRHAFDNIDPANINLVNCGLPTAGPNALAGVDVSGANPPVVSNAVNADPDYASTLVDGTVDQLDVTNVADYGTASSTAGPLAGGADLVHSLDASSLTITVDGDPSDWTGTAGAIGTLVLDGTTNELIYNDPTGDDLGDGDYTAPTDAAFNDTESDIEEVRIAHDGQTLYVLVRTGAYGTGFGADSETAMTQVIINTGDANGPNADDFGGYSDTRLSSALGWEAVFGLGQTDSGVNAFVDGDWGSSLTVTGAQDETNNAVEFSVDLNDIGYPALREINFVIAQGHSEGGSFRQMETGAATQYRGGNGDPTSILNGLISRVYDLASPGLSQAEQEAQIQNAVIAGSEIPVILTGLLVTSVENYELYR